MISEVGTSFKYGPSIILLVEFPGIVIKMDGIPISNRYQEQSIAGHEFLGLFLEIDVSLNWCCLRFLGILVAGSEG